MLFTRASEYALLSLIFIARKNGFSDVETMAKELGISKSFLAKILQSLAKDGILKSYKGANGGFELSVSPDNLNIRKIIESVEKRKMEIFECSSSKEVCPKGDSCQIWFFFNALQSRLDEFLENISLGDILKNG